MTFEQATSTIKNHARRREINIGEKKGILKTVLSMLQEGIDISLITKITVLTEQQIREYQK